MSTIKLSLDFLGYTGTESNNPQDSLKFKKELEISDLEDVTRYFQVTVPAAASDQAISLPNANTDFCMIMTDREVTIKLNGSSDAITIKPVTAGTKVPAFVLHGNVTGLTVSNAGSDAAKLDVILGNK